MATQKAIRKIKTKRTTKRVYKRTPKGKKSKAKPVSKFYGSYIAKGKLHKAMKIPREKKIPISKLKAELARLKKKKKKTARDVKREREIVFALNSKLSWNR